MPSRLELLQKGFVRSVFGEADRELIASVQGGGKLSAADAVDVYRGGYPARMTEALGETFEACWRILGDHNLSDYGRSFSDFLLKRFKNCAPFIGDLGNLEWSFKEIFHAAPHAGLTANNLSVAVKENSILIFGSAVQVLSFKHSPHGLWMRDCADDSPLSR